MATEHARQFPSISSSVPVSEVMARPVVTVDPEMGLLDLMRLFVTAGIGAAPVLDASGLPIGVVSKTDLLRELYDQADGGAGDSFDAPSASTSADEPNDSAFQARHIMTASPVVVAQGASLAHAANLMAREHLHRVFVVDERGAITGVLSSSDLVDWLARGDDDDGHEGKGA